jgi:hypothetical protein
MTDTPLATHLPLDTHQFSPDLTLVIDAWPQLPEAIRSGIVAMVRASLGAPDNSDNSRNCRPTLKRGGN